MCAEVLIRRCMKAANVQARACRLEHSSIRSQRVAGDGWLTHEFAPYACHRLPRSPAGRAKPDTCSLIFRSCTLQAGPEGSQLKPPPEAIHNTVSQANLTHII
jgi:hypothetical protein